MINTKKNDLYIFILLVTCMNVACINNLQTNQNVFCTNEKNSIWKNLFEGFWWFLPLVEEAKLPSVLKIIKSLFLLIELFLLYYLKDYNL